MDRIDADLLDRPRARVDCCERIGQVTPEHAIPMMPPHRMGVVQERGAGYTDQHGIDRDFTRKLYDLIIAETCRIEDAVIGTPSP